MAGNTGATIEGPCMFDPASFFGHSEFELAIMDMFGGFQQPFWTAYHAKVRKILCDFSLHAASDARLVMCKVWNSAPGPCFRLS